MEATGRRIVSNQIENEDGRQLQIKLSLVGSGCVETKAKAFQPTSAESD